MRTIWSGGLLLLTVVCGLRAQVNPARAPVVWHSAVQDKNFYALTLLQRTAAVRQVLKSDEVLGRLAESKRQSLKTAATDCAADVACYLNALLWKDEEIAEAEHRLRELYAEREELRRLTDGAMRQCGLFQRYQRKPGADLLAQAWRDAALGVNHIIDVYGAGKAPRYPEVDSISYDVKATAYPMLLRTVTGVMDDGGTSLELFFEPSLAFAMHLLDANHRDEAGRLEPLESGENAAAIRHMRSISWSKFPYSVIVVPGSGTDRISFSLSAIGKLRLELAARRYREGKAPLVLVSGGYVHPAQTPYAEAIEMKKSLIADFGIPAEAILVEPHARHTTTNLRNAARQMYRYGIPLEKTALITTDQDQSKSIESAAFAQRCTRELGYQPVQLRSRTSRFDLEFVPLLDSLQADAMDPLDP